MKSLIKISSLVIALFLANQAFATNGNPDFTIKNPEEKILYFEASSIASKDFEVRIQNDTGVLIFSEYGMNPETFKRRYNLSELENGQYFLFFENNLEIQVIPIFIENDELKIDLGRVEITEKEIAG